MREKRKEDVNIADFDIRNLNKSEADILTNLLLKCYSTFSKSLDTLFHTDKILLGLKFINDYLTKTFSSPIPLSHYKKYIRINQSSIISWYNITQLLCMGLANVMT